MEHDLALEPDQPAEVAAALAALLGEGGGDADPWWQAGIREALGEPPGP